MKTVDESVKEWLQTDPAFRQAWEENAPAREFGLAITGARLSARLSQRDLAKQIKTSQAMIHQIEHGYLPKVDTLRRLAAALKVDFVITEKPYPIVKPRRRKRRAA